MVTLCPQQPGQTPPCDRLEAIGVVGAVRCYQYNRETTGPLMLDTTPCSGSEEEMCDQVTQARWIKYQQGATAPA